MYREKIEELIKWKKEDRKNILIIKGAPRTGKTWLLKEFGEKYYEKIIYISFKQDYKNNNDEKVSDIKEIITKKENVNIIEDIKKILKIKEESNVEYLIILDDIENSENAVNNLKYLFSRNKQIDIIASTSKYGISLPESIKFPNNKVKYINLKPLNFREFLLATEDIDLKKLTIQEKRSEIENNNSKYLNSLKKYIYIGGMPEIVHEFCTNKNYINIRKMQKNVIKIYENEIDKSPITIKESIKKVWNRIPQRNSLENETWGYSDIRDGARATEFEIAIKYLEDLGYIYKINKISRAEFPLMVYQDTSIFKLYYIDIGLLSAKMDLDLSIILEKNDIFKIFKENLSEQYIMQELKSKIDNSIYCWKSDNLLNFVNFIFQYDGKIYAIKKIIESTKNDLSLKLLHQTNDINNCINITLNKYKYEGWYKDIPIYLIGDIDFIKYKKI